MSEVAPTTAHAVGPSGGGLMAISRSLAGCSLASTQSMRPAVVCLIVFPNVVASLVVVAVAIIVVAVVVSMISVTVALITAVAIVVVVFIPTPMLLVVSAVIGVTSTIIDVHILHILPHGLHMLKHLLLGSIGGSHGVCHLGVKIWRRRRCVIYFRRYQFWFH